MVSFKSKLFPLLYQVGKYHVQDHAEAQSMAEKAVGYAEQAIDADKMNFASHKWMGIIISWSSEFYGTRRKIERSFDVKYHFEVSTEAGKQQAFMLVSLCKGKPMLSSFKKC